MTPHPAVRKAPDACANRNERRHAGAARPIDDLVEFLCKIREVEMAMAVDEHSFPSRPREVDAGGRSDLPPSNR